ncbi:hypothetical protein WB401_06575 [Streptomyces brasiliscabiei]|uniref:Uncharacterized protein n=3 Tax=Streptomyces TaxID=1883 RepID=A0ABU8GSZ0_9ACTN|nr:MULTISPECIES: hypothetical protein [Streptomyces]MBZ3906039.1 hypothetical protein [Streptomyces griseiscabiei]MDX2909672.1 hypothetical protein [Streptomyces griseiscabiei]
MSLDTPIYSRLVAERGDIPARVRDEADRVRRQLEGVIPGSGSADASPGAAQRGSFFGTGPLSP